MRSFWPLFGVVLVLAAVLAGCTGQNPGGGQGAAGCAPGAAIARSCDVLGTDSAAGGGGM